MGTRAKAALAALLLAAALLRFAGLSHDLHEKKVYHPDTAKQVNAVQRFLAGDYYRHIGNKDYDGYPLLHAHLAEWFIRAADPVRRGVLGLLGVPARRDALSDDFAIYWVVLVMNALLSTGTVLAVFVAGREGFGPAAGWVAALLLALSPADVTGAHLATGDTACAFFTALSLLFSLRVLRLGRPRDYALAAAAAVCAFAAKYYAATAFFTLAAAHLLRTGRPAAWFDRDALRKIALAAAVAAGTMLLADPALLQNFTGQLADIRTAMTESTLRFPREMAQAGRWERFVFSMRINLPDFVRCVTPVALLAAMLAVATPLRRDRRVPVLLVGPALYLLLAVGSRAQVPAIYHASVTPPLFLLVGLCATAPWRPGFPAARAARAAAALAVAAAGWLLARDTAREVWFALGQDTRRASEAWARENVPRTFRDRTSRYTFEWFWDDLPGAEPAGTLLASSGLAPIRFPEGSVPLKRFVLERAPVTQFRNVPQELAAGATALLRPGFAVPTAQRWPAETGNRFLFDNGAGFLRAEKQFLLDPRSRLERILVTDRPLREAWLLLRPTAVPAAIHVRFGGRDADLRVAGADGAAVRVADPRPCWPTGDGLWFYRLEADPPPAAARLELATTALEAGRALHLLGRHAEAAPLLAAGALEAGDPGAAARAIVSAAAAGVALPAGDRPRLDALAVRAAAVADDDGLFAAYGVRAAYLDALPFVRIRAERLGANGFRPVPGPHDDAAPGDPPGELVATGNRKARQRGEGYAVWTAPLPLDPGPYRGDLLLRGPGGSGRGGRITLLVTDERGAAVAELVLAPAPADPRAYAAVPFAFEVPAGAAACSLRFAFEEPPDAAVAGVALRPDALAAARALGAALAAAGGAAPPAPPSAPKPGRP